MAEYDVRVDEYDECHAIRFASDADESEPFFLIRTLELDGGYIKMSCAAGDVTFLRSRDVKNLIKALEKAIEFGWTV